MSSTRTLPARAVARPVLLLAALALAACTDGLGPIENLDPVTASQRAEEIYTTMSGNPALESMGILETASPFPAASAMMAATTPFAPSGERGEWLGTRIQRLAAAAPYVTSAEPAVIFPADLLGKVLIYNPATGKYEVAPNQSGAPPNGVRFILYAIDPVFKKPLTDTPVGYADFMDESTPAADALHIIVTINDRVVIDYLATASVEAADGGTVVFGALGFVDNGTKRLDFDLSQRISELAGVSFNYLLEATGEAASVRLTAEARPNQPAHITLTVSRGASSVVLDVTAGEREIAGTVSVNGTVVIEISGTHEAPVFQHPDGSPITEEDARALRDLFRMVDKMSGVVHALLRTAHRILKVPVFAI